MMAAVIHYSTHINFPPMLHVFFMYAQILVVTSLHDGSSTVYYIYT